MLPKNLTTYCQKNDIKLTPLRSDVLEILAKHNNPLTAYEILDLLKESNPKAQVMSVYRVLEFLQNHHLIHRIENLNAFILCNHLSEHHISQWLICEDCGNVEECTDKNFNQAIHKTAADRHFRVTAETIELKGICVNCQDNKQT
ncbi:MAG: transcriptional repressor [Gammaproteobacteria bacterium]|nr:MAG: transcriptional repressor [Gammaproteobacteria bacterium]